MKYCHACGTGVDEEFRYCPRCGQNLATPASPPAGAAPRTTTDRARHVKILAVLLAAWGFLGLLGAGAIFLAAGPIARIVGDVVGQVLPGVLVPSVLLVIGWVVGGLAVAAIAASIGLLNYEGWARPLAVVVLILALLRFPFGTMLGLYGLWVLLSAEGERFYRAMSAARS